MRPWGLQAWASSTLLLALAFVGLAATPAANAEPADFLPIWREAFARPDTRIEAIPSPAGNRLTPAKIALGRSLFSDTRLSGEGTRSCATCHDPQRGFTDGRARAGALDGSSVLANTPPLYDLAWGKRFFWDGRADSLEEQASVPILHGQEMAGSWPTIVARLGADAAMAASFRGAFPHRPLPGHDTITAALASFERTLVSPTTRFDRFIAGDDAALLSSEKEGFALFVGKAGCVSCHSGWRFTDDRLHRTGRSADAIKTPTLRGLSQTAPYMHDGSLATIEAVIVHYEELNPSTPRLASNLVRPLRLGKLEKSSLLAFLNGLAH